MTKKKHWGELDAAAEDEEEEEEDQGEEQEVSADQDSEEESEEEVVSDDNALPELEDFALGTSGLVEDKTIDELKSGINELIAGNEP